MINVTKTYLPPQEEYSKYLDRIWKTSWVTNNGPILKELEEALKKELGVKHLFFMSNGTVVLQIALKALGLTKEIITTPFSYVATTTAILWENCKPVFVDIDKNTLCIDPDLIEQSITENTQAILATHVYGIPCDVEKIEQIAKKHNLKVIYDAAHAFGTIYKGKPLASYGDVSTLSFHATKLFHTIEGGAIITNDDALAAKIKLFRSFGHVGDEYFSIGINGKNSEFHAAMGLCVLPKVQSFIDSRKVLADMYMELLSGTEISNPLVPPDTIYNYGYYPIILKSEELLLKVKEGLLKNDIVPRRYFYPSLNKLPYLTGAACPVSEDIASRVLCLPFYQELLPEEVVKIVSIIKPILASHN
ncbi:MAG TPA: DegT/DnrJ/EryC1/StrS family aminotransferase [Bacteroidia bacterium]|nr:DegT/DnrJ/EryC1/StrS family aminotransferase [Bacteroidia bacterium]